jgi:hypothetical protein
MTLSKADRLLFQEFAALFRSCAVCWWPESDQRRRMEIHHLVGGRGRKHDRRNLLSTCSNCHSVAHSGSTVTGLPDITKGMLLTAKQEADPEHYDPEFLASLLGKKHLGYDPEPLAEDYLSQRQRNVKGWSSRNP